MLPFQALLSVSLSYKLMHFLSHFTAAQQIEGSENRWLGGGGCSWGGDTGSRTGAGKKGNMSGN